MRQALRSLGLSLVAIVLLTGAWTARGEGTAPGNPDLQALIATLENEQARAELLARLKALDAAAEPAPSRNYLDYLFDTAVTEVSRRVDLATQAMRGLYASIGQLPMLVEWFRGQLIQPESRAVWYWLARQIGTAVVAGYLASLLTRAALRSWRARRLDLPLAARRKAKLRASLAHLAVNLAALATFLAVTYLVLSYTAVSILAQRVAGDILLAIACGRSATALSRAVLAPENARRRLVDMDDSAAAEAHRRVTVLVGLAFYGYFALEAAQRLGLPWSVEAFLLQALFLVVAVLLIHAIYRLRAYLGATIERWGEHVSSTLARYLPWRAFALVGHHVLAAWVAVVYLMWAVGSPAAAFLLTRGLLATILALIGVRAANLWLDRILLGQRAETTTTEETAVESEPLPALWVAAITAARLAVAALALGLILQAWGADVLGWLTGETGQTLFNGAARIGLIVIVVAAAGKLVQRATRRYITAQDPNGNPLYSNRTLTLVSMARNLVVTMLIAIGIVEVLSELGVNANALLAGAGVVGLAIGFGAQTLVKDLLNGLFILAGDTVRVGDVVDLGGRSGVVEAISMRTITLRAYNGDVHTVPYSSIDVVTNMTKDFSFYVFDIVVAYREDVDRVIQVLRDLDSQLRREWPYRRLMVEPLEIAGVDAFRETGIVVRARTKVRPGEQWKVGREFNRRIKRRFDELGIELSVPYRKLVLEGGAEETARMPEPLRRAAGEA